MVANQIIILLLTFLTFSTLSQRVVNNHDKIQQYHNNTSPNNYNQFNLFQYVLLNSNDPNKNYLAIHENHIMDLNQLYSTTVEMDNKISQTHSTTLFKYSKSPPPLQSPLLQNGGQYTTSSSHPPPSISNTPSDLLINQNNKLSNSENSSISEPICPYILYGKHWEDYKQNPKNRNVHSSSPREHLLNERLLLYNQTEWNVKFPEQPNPLTCPKFTINKWRRYVPMVDPSHNILYYLGEEIDYCKTYEKFEFSQKVNINGTIVMRNFTEYFQFAEVCDRLFCFSKSSLAMVNDDVSKFGLNLTTLLSNTTIYTSMFPQRVALQFLERWALSYDDDFMHDVDPESLNVTPMINKLMHYLVPYLPFNFTNMNQIAEYYTVCSSCRDYTKHPILPTRDVCISIDFPFQCSYGNKESENHFRDGYPLMEMVSRRNNIFKNVMNMTAEPMCYCPRPGTVKLNEKGNDVTFGSYTLFNTKIASQCDIFTQFWYPLYDSKFLSIILIMLEVILNSIMFTIVLLPLFVQFIKEILMKINAKPMRIPKMGALMTDFDKIFTPPLVERNEQKERIQQKKTSVTLFMHTSSAYNKRTWKRILFDLRLYSAVVLQLAYFCFLGSDILGASSNIDSASEVRTSESVMFLTGSGFCLIGTMPILAMWVDVMKKTENNSERISLKVSIPLFVLMTFGFCGVVAYAISDYFNPFFSSAVFMLCLVIIFMCVIIGLFTYGFRIYWNLRKVSRINFFQFRFTKFLVAASIFAIFPGFYMVFDIASSIYQSFNGLYPSDRFYYLYSTFFTSILLLAFGGSLVYVLFPSFKLLSESYQLIIYSIFCCCGKSPRVKNFKERQQAFKEQYESSWSDLSETSQVVGRLPYNSKKSQHQLKSTDFENSFNKFGVNLNSNHIAQIVEQPYIMENDQLTINSVNDNEDEIQVDDSIYYENQIDELPKSQKHKELSQPLL